MQITTTTIFTMMLIALLVMFTSAQEIYHKTKELCCDGQVYEKTRGAKCCGQKMYDSADKVCCGNHQTVDLPNDVDAVNGKCCVNEKTNEVTGYNEMTQLCCNGHVKTYPDLNLYGCCNTELYDFVKETCCGSEIFELRDNLQCCGDEMVTIEPGTSAACCDNRIIDTTKQMCCMVVHLDTNTGYPIVTKKSHDQIAGQNYCCGLDPFNVDTSVCCALWRSGKIIGRYLLPKPVLPTGGFEFACCGQEVLVMKDALYVSKDGLACCYSVYSENSVSYNPITELCCYGNVKTKGIDMQTDDQCCSSTEEFYDSETHVCTNTGVKLLSEDNELGADEDYCMPK